MKRAERRQKGKSALDLIEEAVHLLRTSPTGTLAAYAIGTLPFVLGLLYFWMDMARSAYGEGHLAAGALGMTLLFLWMKMWQTIFARNLRASLGGGTPLPFSFRRCWRVFVTQAAFQWTGLFLLPLALLLVFPFAWVYPFYQSLTALDDGEACTLREFIGKTTRQAFLWPAQNHALLALLAGFGLYIFLNWCTVCYAIPEAVRVCFGVESVFTRSPMSMLNSTFFAAMVSLTYLCVDPIVKAAYTLRCFYGDSLKSGEDLKADLQQYILAATQIAVCLIAALVLMGVTPSASASMPYPGGQIVHASPPVPYPGGQSALASASVPCPGGQIARASASVPCPGGTFENSPMLQRWVWASSQMSPEEF